MELPRRRQPWSEVAGDWHNSAEKCNPCLRNVLVPRDETRRHPFFYCRSNTGILGSLRPSGHRESLKIGRELNLWGAPDLAVEPVVHLQSVLVPPLRRARKARWSFGPVIG